MSSETSVDGFRDGYAPGQVGDICAEAGGPFFDYDGVLQASFSSPKPRLLHHAVPGPRGHVDARYPSDRHEPKLTGMFEVSMTSLGPNEAPAARAPLYVLHRAPWACCNVMQKTWIGGTLDHSRPGETAIRVWSSLLLPRRWHGPSAPGLRLRRRVSVCRTAALWGAPP